MADFGGKTHLGGALWRQKLKVFQLCGLALINSGAVRRLIIFYLFLSFIVFIASYFDDSLSLFITSLSQGLFTSRNEHLIWRFAYLEAKLICESNSKIIANEKHGFSIKKKLLHKVYILCTSMQAIHLKKP